MTALTALRPMLDDLVDRPRRQERPTLALMPRLGALSAPRRVLAAPGGVPGGSALGGCEAVTRAAVQPALKLSDALVLASDALRSTAWIWRSIRNNTSTTASRPAS